MLLFESSDRQALFFDQRLKSPKCPVAMVPLRREQVCDLVEFERLVSAEAVGYKAIIVDDARCHRAHPYEKARREAMVVGIAEVLGGVLERRAGNRLDAELERTVFPPTGAERFDMVEIERPLSVSGAPVTPWRGNSTAAGRRSDFACGR